MPPEIVNQPSLFDEPTQTIDLPPQEALEQARREASTCRACPLWETGTQTVFGNGPARARIMFVGEAPGEQEDRQGVPFVGPAGKLFDSLLAEAGINRHEVFVSNVVKHRPSEETDSGRRRNRAPRQSEIRACHAWLERELRIIQPQIVVCIGGPAARVLIGKDFRLTEQRGQWFSTSVAPNTIAILHPAYLLKQTDRDTEERLRGQILADLQSVAQRHRALQSEAALP